MKQEYDFSKGQCGRFFHKDATLNLPIYLDEDNRAFVESVAQRKNLDVSAVVNNLIRSDREILRAIE